MTKPSAGADSVQQFLQRYVDEPVPLKRTKKDSEASAGKNVVSVPLKRKKKDSGAPAGKNAVVLKCSDVIIKNSSVFMPNTIEMARLKKKENCQFVTNVQISSKMSQQDIRELLISLFPYLGDQR